MLDKWMAFYNEDRPAFDSVEGMLKSVNLYDGTQYTFEELLQNAGLSQLLIDELITVLPASLWHPRCSCCIFLVHVSLILHNYVIDKT